MLRLLIDENFDHRILRGVRLALPSLDYLTIQETDLSGRRDPIVLEWAAHNERVIATHDVNTMPKHAYDRVRDRQTMPGVIVVPEDLAIGIAIEELATLVERCLPEEIENQVKYLPT